MKLNFKNTRSSGKQVQKKRKEEELAKCGKVKEDTHILLFTLKTIGEVICKSLPLRQAFRRGIRRLDSGKGVREWRCSFRPKEGSVAVLNPRPRRTVPGGEFRADHVGNDTVRGRNVPSFSCSKHSGDAPNVAAAAPNEMVAAPNAVAMFQMQQQQLQTRCLERWRRSKRKRTLQEEAAAAGAKGLAMQNAPPSPRLTSTLPPPSCPRMQQGE
ncbi:uncharacterized protein LOC113416538 [Notechis scutatus]|uniref:Uncharacterized protein LOC113416538 n=1 Tax=Notechis scutatus TaxID=8663 RepID=A0A6J1UIW1_9SAUR|nr:uncharacterized protein LOC113416538 [Notechis scutatus]